MRSAAYLLITMSNVVNEIVGYRAFRLSHIIITFDATARMLTLTLTITLKHTTTNFISSVVE